MQDGKTTFAEQGLDFTLQYVKRVCDTVQKLPIEDMEPVLLALGTAQREKRQVFLAGNGGSAATASHMANDLMKGVAANGNASFRAICLADNVPLITAIANDIDYSEAFSHQLKALAQAGDLLIVLSGSGKSANIIRAVETAREMGVKTIGFLGKDGGAVKEMVDLPVVVPSDDYGIIEVVHAMFDHLITEFFRDLE